MKKLKSGQRVPASGQYALVGTRGRRTIHEVTGVQGKRLPPTPKPGQGYVLNDPTNNKSGRGK